MLAKNLSRFRLVTFDLTQTIVNFRNPPDKEYISTASKFLRTKDYFDEKLIKKSFRSEFKRMNKEHPNFGFASIGWREWWRILVVEIFKKSLLQEVDPEVFNVIASQLIHDYKTDKCWVKEESVDELFREIKQEGKLLGIISNFDPRIRTLLKNLQVQDLDFVITSYEYGIEKPTKCIFDLALRRANEFTDDIIHQDQCLHVGNDVTKDFLGAKNSGWNSALIGPRETEYSPCFKDINQFYTVLRNEAIKW